MQAARQNLQAKMMTLKAIWTALLFSLVVYIYLAFTIVEDANTAISLTALEGAMNDNQLLPILILVATITFAVSIFVPKLILKASLKEMPQPIDVNSQEALGKYLTSFILGVALGESCAIFGLIAAMDTRTSVVILPFAAMSVFRFLLSPPSVDAYVNTIQNLSSTTSTGSMIRSK